MRKRSARRTRERRRQHRNVVTAGALRNHTLEARLLNFSPGGIALETGRALRITARYQFHLGSSGEGRPITGTVRWCRLCATRKLENGDFAPVFRAGLALDSKD